MIKIKNKNISIRVNTQLGITPIEKKYSDLIIELINLPPKEGGFTVTEMRSRLQIIDKLEQANGEIELTEAESVKIKDSLNRMTWRFLSKEILEFIEIIENLK